MNTDTKGYIYEKEWDSIQVKRGKSLVFKCVTCNFVLSIILCIIYINKMRFDAARMKNGEFLVFSKENRTSNLTS